MPYRTNAPRTRNYGRNFSKRSYNYQKEIEKGIREGNPISSPEQWGLMQAVASGASRVKGISQAIAEEMIRKTPRKLRSKFAKELARIRHNPSVVKKNGEYWFKSIMGELGPYKTEGEAWRKGWQLFREYQGKMHNPSSSDVDEMVKKFHGREPQEVIEVDEHETYRGDNAVLGLIEEMTVLSPSRRLIDITFEEGEQPYLTCGGSKDSKLELINGDQHLDVKENGLVPIGYVVILAYSSDKHHLEDSNGDEASYDHFFGEASYKEWGFDRNKYEDSDVYLKVIMDAGLVDKAIEQEILPMIVYDCENEKILLVGGKYRIEDVGIVN